MIIGLTGGIATGKSESAKYFKKLGAYIVDADAVSHDLTAKGTPALAELVKYFGKGILEENGALNRKKLAEIIFSDPESKLRVEKIIHPYIISCVNEIIAENFRKYDIIINAPLLFEVGIDRICDKIVVVWAPYAVQAKRLALRDNLTKEQVDRRIKSQMPIEEKIKMADYVIDNSGPKKDLGVKVKNLYARLKQSKD